MFCFKDRFREGCFLYRKLIVPKPIKGTWYLFSYHKRYTEYTLKKCLVHVFIYKNLKKDLDQEDLRSHNLK